MAVYFKLNEDGSVLVANNYLFSKMDEYEFYEKGIIVDAEKFLSKYTDQERKVLKLQIERLQEIHKMKLSMLGPRIDYKANGDYEIKACYIGDTLFKVFYTNKKIQKLGIARAKKFYGEDFMDEIIEKQWLLQPTKEQVEELSKTKEIDEYSFVKFISQNKLITMEEYFKLEEERTELTQIRDAKNPLAKKVDLKSKKRR